MRPGPRCDIVKVARRRVAPTMEATVASTVGQMPGWRRRTFPLAGAAAGIGSAVTFAWNHALLISDIWFFVVPMMVAGAICGLCIAVTFRVLVRSLSVGVWVLYNAAYVGLFALLGTLSVIVYEPITTIPALLALSGPPEHLFRQALPLTVAFGLGSAAVIAAVFGHRWWHLVPAVLTMVPLTLFLGLNISVMGLVEFPRSAWSVVALTFGLIVAIVVVYAAVFVALEWRPLRYDLGRRTG